MEILGEQIEHYYPEGEKDFYSTPVSPLQNIYTPHLLRLAQIKLRIGHAMARNAAKAIKKGYGLFCISNVLICLKNYFPN